MNTDESKLQSLEDAIDRRAERILRKINALKKLERVPYELLASQAYWTVQEAIEIFRLDGETVRSAFRKGLLPGVCFGTRKWRIENPLMGNWPLSIFRGPVRRKIQRAISSMNDDGDSYRRNF